MKLSLTAREIAALGEAVGSRLAGETDIEVDVEALESARLKLATGRGAGTNYPSLTDLRFAVKRVLRTWQGYIDDELETEDMARALTRVAEIAGVDPTHGMSR